MSKLIVTSHRPQKTKILVGLIITAFLFAGWSLFEYGRYRAGFDHIEAAKNYAELAATREALEEQLEQLREKKAVLERTLQVERKASNDVRISLTALQSEILELNEELAFYRGIVSPRDSRRGLHLQTFKLVPLGSDGTYRYKVVLTQVLKNERLAYGKVLLRFEGTDNGKTRVLNLADVSEKRVKELNYKFKYFQALEGKLQLPESFGLRRVAVEVRPRGRIENMIEKTFEWATKEQ